MDVLLNQKFQLPDEIWTVLLEEPEQRLRFVQGPFEVEVRLIQKHDPPMLSSDTLSPKDTPDPLDVGLPPTPQSHMTSRPPVLTTAERRAMQEQASTVEAEPGAKSWSAPAELAQGQPEMSARAWSEPLQTQQPYGAQAIADPMAFMNSFTMTENGEDVSAGSDTMLVAFPAAPPAVMEPPAPLPPPPAPLSASSTSTRMPLATISPPPTNSSAGLASAARSNRFVPTTGMGTNAGASLGFGLSAAIHGDLPVMEPRNDLSTQIGIRSVPSNMKPADWQSLIGEPNQRRPLAPQVSPVEDLTPTDNAYLESLMDPEPSFLAADIASDDASEDDDWSVELDLGVPPADPVHDDWKQQESVVFRLLRGSDTIPALRMLFDRNAANVIMLDHMFQNLPPHHPPPSQFAEASGVSCILEQLIPLCYKADETPHFRVIGCTHHGDFVVLYQQQDSMSLVFMPLEVDGHMPQIALIEGETLFTEEELTELFQAGARSASPEEAQAKARQVQIKLDTGNYPSVGREANFNLPSTSDKIDGLDKSIAVDQRLLNRFEFHRHHNRDLWDEDLQPGIAVFRQNAATLYINNQSVIEGVLLCLLKQQQYIVFDRRSKRSINLQPDTGQRLWLRKDDSFES